MADAGLFDQQRVELIDGEVLEMSPQNHPHAMAIVLIDRALRRVLPDGYFVRVQMPLAAGEASEPEPDIAVIAGDPRDFEDHPSTAALVVEVADTSLSLDRGRKAELYASMTISEYWILNLPDRQLEVHREPITEAAAMSKARFDSRRVLAPGDAVAPLCVPAASIDMAELMP